MVDVVFVHGIRGGPFATWRASGGEYGAASRNLGHNVCWPSAWLAHDVPGARLLSMEYASPVSKWEVCPTLGDMHVSPPVVRSVGPSPGYGGGAPSHWWAVQVANHQ